MDTLVTRRIPVVVLEQVPIQVSMISFENKKRVGVGGIDLRRCYSHPYPHFVYVWMMNLMNLHLFYFYLADCSHFSKTENRVYIGSDIGATYQNTYGECCQQCSLNNKCNAFSWDRRTKACYLKSSTGDGGLVSSDVDSGHRLGRNTNISNNRFLKSWWRQEATCMLE